ETEPQEPGPATVDGHSVGLSQAIVGRRPARAWLFGAAAILAVLLVVTSVALTRKGPEPKQNAVMGAVSVELGASGAPHLPGSDDLDTMDVPSATAPATADKRTGRPTRTTRPKPRPKPIATTPGF